MYEKHSKRLHKQLEKTVAAAQKKYGSSRVSDISYKDTKFGKSIVNSYGSESLGTALLYSTFMTKQMANKQRHRMNREYALWDTGRLQDSLFNPFTWKTVTAKPGKSWKDV